MQWRRLVSLSVGAVQRVSGLRGPRHREREHRGSGMHEFVGGEQGLFPNCGCFLPWLPP